MTFALLTLVLSAAPRLVAPGAVAQTTRERVHVFVEAEGAFRLTVNGGEASCTSDARFGLDGGARLAHCLVALKTGRNVVTATAPGVDAEAESEAVIARYLTTGPLPPGVDAMGFGAGTLHRPDVEATCRGCHVMEPPLPDAGVTPASMCGSCHAEVTQRKVMHGPVLQGACLACHDEQSAPTRYAVRWPIQDTCFSCHLDVKATMATKAVRHGPAAAGRCTTCHDPHGSDEPFWLKQRAYDLCTSCHLEKRGERHVVVGFAYGDSHPLQQRPHPLKERTEFACPACHNPHAAKARFLWQFDVTTRESLCRTCHQK